MTFRVALVCLGNICRSPMADVVLQEHLLETGLDVEVSSCGTGDWHVGEPMDARAADVLTGSGYDPSRHRAQTFGRPWFAHDLILTMDARNYRDVIAQLPPERHDRVRMFRSFDPEARGGSAPDVPDPWYGGVQGFHDVLAMVERTCTSLVEHLRRELAEG